MNCYITSICHHALILPLTLLQDFVPVVLQTRSRAETATRKLRPELSILIHWLLHPPPGSDEKERDAEPD